MLNKILGMLLLLAIAVQLGCSRMTLHQDYGKAVAKNKVLQTVNLSASKESHPEVKMDGQKADSVVDNYRSERPEVDSADLTK